MKKASILEKVKLYKQRKIASDTVKCNGPMDVFVYSMKKEEQSDKVEKEAFHINSLKRTQQVETIVTECFAIYYIKK